MKNLDEYKRRWRAIEGLTGIHVVTSVEAREEIVSVDYGDVTSYQSVSKELNYASGETEMVYTSYESFDDGDSETMSEYSVASSVYGHHHGSTRSMDNPYKHQQQQQQQRKKLKSMKPSISDSKLPAAGMFKSSNMGTYQKIEEDIEEPSNNALPKNNSSPNMTPNVKRRLFKKSKGN